MAHSGPNLKVVPLRRGARAGRGIRQGHAGFSLLIIFLPTLGMLGDPLGGGFFGSEALNYFRIAIGP
jgi:hypothetical protein